MLESSRLIFINHNMFGYPHRYHARICQVFADRCPMLHAMSLITGRCPRARSHRGHGLNRLRLPVGHSWLQLQRNLQFLIVFLLFRDLFCDSSAIIMLLSRCKWMHVCQHCQPKLVWYLCTMAIRCNVLLFCEGFWFEICLFCENLHAI